MALLYIQSHQVTFLGQWYQKLLKNKLKVKEDLSKMRVCCQLFNTKKDNKLGNSKTILLAEFGLMTA